VHRMALLIDVLALATLSGFTATAPPTSGSTSPAQPSSSSASSSPLPRGAAAPGFERFTVKGSLTASTVSVTDSEGRCSYSDGTFSLQTDPMLLGHGEAVARLSVTVLGFKGAGRYNATMPLQQYRRTPLYLTTARDTASGAATSEYGAATGHVTITSVTPLDTPRRRATVEGTLRAILRQRGEGNGAISAQGSWRCTIGEWP
jgi:hypothetical protein